MMEDWESAMGLGEYDSILVELHKYDYTNTYHGHSQLRVKASRSASPLCLITTYSSVCPT